MAQMTEMARGLVTLADVNSCFRPSPTDAISRQKHRPGIHRSRKAVFINRLAPVQCHNCEQLQELITVDWCAKPGQNLLNEVSSNITFYGLWLTTESNLY